METRNCRCLNLEQRNIPFEKLCRSGSSSGAGIGIVDRCYCLTRSIAQFLKRMVHSWEYQNNTVFIETKQQFVVIWQDMVAILQTEFTSISTSSSQARSLKGQKQNRWWNLVGQASSVDSRRYLTCLVSPAFGCLLHIPVLFVLYLKGLLA